MPRPDLYEILNVPRDASTASIKASYRWLTAKTHTDETSDTEQFKLLKLAYDVLSDPEQRELYDETGETAAERAERLSDEHQFRAQAADFLISVIAQSGPPQIIDIAEKARSAIEVQIAFGVEQLEKLTTFEAKLAEAKKRLYSSKGDDLLSGILDERLQDLHKTIEALRQQQARWIRLQALLKDYHYEQSDESIL